jgi:DNA-binding response OmpR family regulator
MDVNMPEMNGFELAAKIRQVDSRVMIFFLTDRTEKSDRLLGFKVKGNDYIPKPFYPEELIAKIHERFDSVVASDDEVFQLGNTLFCPSTTSLTYAGETHNLSVRQSEILRMFAKNVGKMVDRDAILQQVWGDDSYANSLALNVQITYLRRQLTDPSIQIVSIKKRGYILSITV